MLRIIRYFNHIAARYDRSVIGIIAAGTLIVILVATTVMWPISLLGFHFDSETHKIESIEPFSAAAHSGLRPGDLIISFYERPMAAFVRSNAFWFIEPPGSVAPMVVAREGRRITAA